MPRQYEEQRLAKLTETGLLDTLPEQEFDDIVTLCAQICEAPIGLISLMDDKRQWFKANFGLAALTQTPREVAFCDHTVRLRETLVVEDATRDWRFRENPAVTGEPGVRFYAGAPLLTSDGYCIGTLCVIDVKVRKLTDGQKTSLETLARIVMTAIAKRTLVAEAQLDRLQAKHAQLRLHDMTASLEAGVFSIDKTGRCTFVNGAWGRITGLTQEQSIGYAYMSSIVEEDRIKLFDQLMKARENREVFKETARIRRPDGSVRVVECYSVPDRDGGRIGTAYDVTDYVERIRTLEKELSELRTPMLKMAK